VTLSANFRGKEGSSTNEFWYQKTRVPVLLRGVNCVILRLAVLIQCRRVTHRHTDRHAIMAISRAELGSARVKTEMTALSAVAVSHAATSTLVLCTEPSTALQKSAL